MKQKQTTFYCFSPPVMLATFSIEVIMIGYTLWRYRISTLTRLAALLLANLAVFQIAEYNVCGGMTLQAATWSRIGYIAITLLPALGYHLMQTIAKRPIGRGVLFGYASAAIFVSLFAFSQSAFSGYVCGGNYVIFQLKPPLGGLFFIWYYAMLLVTMYKAMKFSQKTGKKIRSALQAQVIGYALFMVPTSIVNLFSPSTLSAVPSIMCGFAILFAITIVVGIMPLEKERIQLAKIPRR